MERETGAISFSLTKEAEDSQKLFWQLKRPNNANNQEEINIFVWSSQTNLSSSSSSSSIDFSKFLLSIDKLEYRIICKWRSAHYIL